MTMATAVYVRRAKGHYAGSAATGRGKGIVLIVGKKSPSEVKKVKINNDRNNA
jgi:hypothetical protein